VTGTREQNRWLALLQAPAVGVLLLWMTVPLGMTIYFSFKRYNLLNPDVHGFAGFQNYKFLWEDESFLPALSNTLILAGAVTLITTVVGTALAVVFERRFYGRSLATLLAIAPFFVMPTVSALVWKNMILHPVYGLLARLSAALSLPAVDWFGRFPMLSIIMILSWEWLPFAFLVLLTAIKSLDREQVEAARLDGAGGLRLFYHVVLPHLRRAIGVVVMIETIYLLSIFAEIFTTTSGGPGHATTNLAYLVFSLGLQQFDVGIASAGGILAVILANLVAAFLVRIAVKNLKGAH
jgi:sorbitol/mannitol transport system permease protein